MYVDIVSPTVYLGNYFRTIPCFSRVTGRGRGASSMNSVCGDPEYVVSGATSIATGSGVDGGGSSVVVTTGSRTVFSGTRIWDSGFLLSTTGSSTGGVVGAGGTGEGAGGTGEGGTGEGTGAGGGGVGAGGSSCTSSRRLLIKKFAASTSMIASGSKTATMIRMMYLLASSIETPKAFET